MHGKCLRAVAAALGGLLGLAEPAFAQSWTRTSAPITNCAAVASSSDGTKLAATAHTHASDPIYTLNLSSNPGLTWVETSAPYENWTGIACSADGSRLVAAAYTWGEPGITHSGSVWLSADSGDTW